MKSILIALTAAASLAVAGSALAQSGDDVIKAKCSSCHAQDTKKVGPAFKDVNAKYKGDAKAVDTLAPKLLEGKGHPKVNAPEADIKAALTTVLK